MTHGSVVRSALIAALIPVLAYYAGDIVIWGGMLPLWHWGLPAVVFTAATVAAIAAKSLSPSQGARMLGALETLARYLVAYLLVIYGMNKLLPGQFLVYNRDLDLPLREVSAFRVAWHFLGYSALYVKFAAAFELLAAGLLCWRATALAGLLVSSAALLNIVVIDIAFDIPPVPIPTTMLLAVLVLLAGEVPALRMLVWRPGSGERGGRVRQGLIPLFVLTAFLALELKRGADARNGLMDQLAHAGRWEVVECVPNPGLLMCQPQATGSPAVLYLEIGWWGQLVAGAVRQDVEFEYPEAGTVLEIRILFSDGESGPPLILSGAISATDTVATLSAREPGSAEFLVRLRRTRAAPWPPTGWVR